MLFDNIPIANGGQPLNGKALEINAIYHLVQQLEKIPSQIRWGLKENVYFITNLQTDTHTKRAMYFDDCGVWDSKSSSTTKTTYIEKDGHLIYIAKKAGSYYTGNKKDTLLDPQPVNDNVITAHRYYAVLKSDLNYKKE